MTHTPGRRYAVAVTWGKCTRCTAVKVGYRLVHDVLGQYIVEKAISDFDSSAGDARERALNVVVAVVPLSRCETSLKEETLSRHNRFIATLCPPPRVCVEYPDDVLDSPTGVVAGYTNAVSQMCDKSQDILHCRVFEPRCNDYLVTS